MYKFLLAAAFSAVASVAGATTIVVDGQSAVYGAGIGGNGVSLAASEFSFTPANELYITASYLGGTTDCCGPTSSPRAGADGAALTGGSGTNIGALNGISGIKGPTQQFLVGVFVNSANLPTSGSTAPATLDFNDIGTRFFELNPLLNQAFWIGDGLTSTGSGTQQKFFAPDEADTLLLGFADGGGFSGTPFFYGDNVGALTMSIEANFTPPVPLPAGLPLLLAGLGMFGLAKRRKSAS